MIERGSAGTRSNLAADGLAMRVDVFTATGCATAIPDSVG